jgi:hypothetical protein
VPGRRVNGAMRSSRRTVRVLALATTASAALALSAPLSIAKDPKWVGPVNQPPLSLGQASVELKVHFGHKSHGSKKLVPKNLLAKEINVYFPCADGQDYYPTGGGVGDFITSSHTAIEGTIFVKKNKTFNVTDTSSGDIDSGSFNLQGRFHGRTASGTLRMENHYNDGSNHGDALTCDTGVLSWTASAP